MGPSQAKTEKPPGLAIRSNQAALRKHEPMKDLAGSLDGEASENALQLSAIDGSANPLPTGASHELSGLWNCQS
jgi:hypothetical protein